MNDRDMVRLARHIAAKSWRRRALGSFLAGTLATVGGVAPFEAAARKEWSERRIIRIVHEAADRYDQPRKAMVRVARCESNLDPYARNPAGPYLGLFQFLRSTWKTTPYRDEDIFDPKANAFAAAWMWKKGRRDEWACQ
jgi:hypothetical protein